MANVNEMFDKVTGEQSYFKPGNKKTITPLSKGEYLGHITEVNSKILDVQGKYKARLYTYTVVVADENKTQKYTYNGIDGKPVETDGAAYIGKKFLGRLWRFLEPTENDDFESWTDDSSEPLIFIHILDRGLDLSFSQYQWFEFMRNITKTNSKIKSTHCYHEIPNQNKKICCKKRKERL